MEKHGLYVAIELITCLHLCRCMSFYGRRVYRIAAVSLLTGNKCGLIEKTDRFCMFSVEVDKMVCGEETAKSTMPSKDSVR